MSWLIKAFLSVFSSLLSWILCPILPLFAKNEFGPTDNNKSIDIEPRLLGYLRYFSTSDNSLLGDNGHKARWQNRSKYLQMVAWIFRNPAYVFDSEVIGAKITSNMNVTATGNVFIKNRNNGVAGSYFVTVGKYWNWKLIKKLPFINYCIMIEAGWKLQDYAKNYMATDSKAGIVIPFPRLTPFTK